MTSRFPSHSTSWGKREKKGKRGILGILSYWTNNPISGLLEVWANTSPFTPASNYWFISTFPQEAQNSAGVNLLDEVMPDYYLGRCPQQCVPENRKTFPWTWLFPSINTRISIYGVVNWYKSSHANTSFWEVFFKKHENMNLSVATLIKIRHVHRQAIHYLCSNLHQYYAPWWH